MKAGWVRLFGLLAMMLPAMAMPSPEPSPEPAAAAAVAFRGSLSRVPAKRWEDGFVTGNGRMGALWFGDPANETLVASHCRLFLPLGNREVVPDLAAHLPEIRRISRAKGYYPATEMMDFLRAKAVEQGYHIPRIPTDPFHPGLFINIRQQPAGAVTDYQRSENFQTGEVCVRWRDERGEFRRRLFVSRTDNVIALSLTGPAPCELEFPALGHRLIQSQQQTTPEAVTYHNVYAKGKGGYDAAVRIIRQDEGREVLLLIRIVPWKTPLPQALSEAWPYSPDHPDFKQPGIFQPVPALADSSVLAYQASEHAMALLPQLRQSLDDVHGDYATLLAPHAVAHAALFNRVRLDLGGGPDQARPTEELLDLAAKENRLPPALMEKMYDAGRYMLICAAGELLPNLQGLWSGSWDPQWSGDFTLDTNVQSAMAAACSGNLADLMEGYFRKIESFYPEWRLNAKRIYGCRGLFSGARASNTGLLLHWGYWDLLFWTAGSGWLASFFSDYAAYTDDHEFLLRRCVPLLKEIAAFQEDFLTEHDAAGLVEFIPSYNPETGCGINATMDIAVAREVLTHLIAACRELKVAPEDLPKWEALLAKLPPYPINERGELSEWPDGSIVAGHRHHSQLYPCFQSFDPLFETDATLRQAAQASVRVKIAGSDGGGEQSSFGRVQCGVAAAFLGMPEEAYGRLKVMAVKRSMNLSLITSHEPNAEIFNTDGNGGIPQIVNTMLLFSRPGQIDLLPALPQAWPTGKVTGLRARGGFTVDIEWQDGKVIDYRITASEARAVRVRVNGKVQWEMAGKS
ncbi:MAG: glycoside hydrolase N-terminal domain-containing protein [Verrucomicrobia bacterium]|nr:glycoside hydrolase N-terminal domain-containing protein [Verrucomicrobiota bacterium]